MTDRKEVEALLAESRAHTGRKAGLIAELCRTWLAVKDAPRVGLFDSRIYGWSIDGDLPERFNGIDVRIVPDPTP